MSGEESQEPGKRQGLIAELWAHRWGRVLMIAATIAVVSWALRETASVTYPIVSAVASVLVPLLIGFTIAYVLTPVVDAFSRHGVKRLVATSVIFLCFTGLSLVTLILGVPAIVDQSSQLVSRMVEDRAFLDLDGDGIYDTGEPLLVMDPDHPNRFLPMDGDPAAKDDPTVGYFIGRDPVVVSPSIARHVLAWFDEQQSRVERYVGSGLNERDIRFLRFYRRGVEPFTTVLNAGLDDANNALPMANWHPALQVRVEDLPELEVAWLRHWPGVTPEQFEAAALTLADDEQRVRWRAVMSRYGRAFELRHQRLLEAWELVQTGRGSTDLVRPTAVEDADEPPVGNELELPPVTADLLRRLETETVPVLARQLYEVLAEELSGELAVEDQRFLEKLQDAADQDGLFARDWFRAIRPNQAGDGALDLLFSEVTGEVRNNVAAQSRSLATDLGETFNISALLNFSLNLVLIPIYAFFLTLAMPGVRTTLRRYLPSRQRESIIDILHEIERVVAAFFRGRLIVCLICGVLVAIGFLLLGVPYAILFGLLIGLATTVPLSGLLFLVPAVLLTVMDGGDAAMLRAILAIGVYTVVQTLEMTLFTPTIMGREVELHPVTLILALLLCGKLLGIIGLILAVPIAATVRILARRYLLPRLRAMADLPAHSALWSKRSGMAASPALESRAADESVSPGNQQEKGS